MDVELCMKPYKFNIGDKVWLQAKQIKIHQQSAKLGPKQLGPFEVTEVRSDVDYKLALPPALRIHDVFHVDHLSPYKGNEVNGQTPPPPEPISVEGEEEYKVDHIRDSKLFGRTLKYLVCWTGYREGECYVSHRKPLLIVMTARVSGNESWTDGSVSRSCTHNTRRHTLG